MWRENGGGVGLHGSTTAPLRSFGGYCPDVPVFGRGFEDWEKGLHICLWEV